VAEWKLIPGETPIDPSALIDQSLGSRQQISEAEGRNIADVLYKYLLADVTSELAPFDFVWAVQLHGEMFGRVWKWAGRLRKIDLNIGLPWTQVESRLFDLLQTLPYWSDMAAVEQAARLHHGAVAIHPFENGNGRWSRMLANIWLKLNNEPPTIWPEATIGSVSLIRDEYLAALKAADAMDYKHLIELHTQYAGT
jgi:Fic-DOC domain mobile mystery protein B